MTRKELAEQRQGDALNALARAEEELLIASGAVATLIDFAEELEGILPLYEATKKMWHRIRQRTADDVDDAHARANGAE